MQDLVCIEPLQFKQLKWQLKCHLQMETNVQNDIQY